MLLLKLGSRMLVIIQRSPGSSRVIEAPVKIKPPPGNEPEITLVSLPSTRSQTSASSTGVAETLHVTKARRLPFVYQVSKAALVAVVTQLLMPGSPPPPVFS